MRALVRLLDVEFELKRQKGNPFDKIKHNDWLEEEVALTERRVEPYLVPQASPVFFRKPQIIKRLFRRHVDMVKVSGRIVAPR